MVQGPGRATMVQGRGAKSCGAKSPKGERLIECGLWCHVEEGIVAEASNLHVESHKGGQALDPEALQGNQ